MNRLLNQICQGYTLADECKQMGIYPYYTPIESEQSTEVYINGKKVLMFGSNSYLGLSNDPRLKEAAKAAIDKYGTSCSGSRFLNGTLDIHQELEGKLARFVGKEDAVTYSTGMQVNLGVISCLAFRGGYVLLDTQDHASIIDGSRLGFANVLKFKHNDLDALEAKLKACDRDKYKLIVIDDAHSLGVLGRNGRGTADHFGETDRVDLIMGTFSKSFGSLGGFIAGDSDVLNYLKHNSRSLIFSASMPPANVASVSKALDIMLEEPERFDRLWDLTRYAQAAFKNAGFDTGRTQSPIIPLFVRDTFKALAIVHHALEEGIFVTPVIAPAVAQGDELIRFALMATHTYEQIDFAVEKLTKVFRKLEIL